MIYHGSTADDDRYFRGTFRDLEPEADSTRLLFEGALRGVVVNRRRYSMATLTISTTGLDREKAECHDVGEIDYSRFYGDSDRRQVVIVELTIDQALGIAYDLLYQAVDADKISGWNVQFPEADWLDGSSKERDAAAMT